VRELTFQASGIRAERPLGGESSREFLGRMSGRGGRIGRACSAALESAGQPEVSQGPADMQNANEIESEVCQ